MTIGIPTSFPVWIQGPNGEPVICNDALSYTALAKQGYTFDNANPPVSHPGQQNASQVVPPVVQVSLNKTQPPHSNPGKVK